MVFQILDSNTTKPWYLITKQLLQEETVAVTNHEIPLGHKKEILK